MQSVRSKKRAKNTTIPRPQRARGPRVDPLRFVLNCVPSKETENDWSLADAVSAGSLDAAATVPAQKDLRWIANTGPILTRLSVDRTWDQASSTQGQLAEYLPSTARGGHAVCLVGYTQNHFIVRNTWGVGWGDSGFAYASNASAQAAFTEAYGAIL